MSTLKRAIALAFDAHGETTDKAGAPYILHPLRVMLRMTTPEERIAAVLHDVVEDCEGWSFERLRAEGFSEGVIKAIEALTHTPNPSDQEYFEAIRRAASNPIARRVKRVDLEDNLDPRRIPEVSARDRARLNRYKKALILLEMHGAGICAL